MQFRKIADLLGFTKTEFTVISFLLIVFLISLVINHFRAGGNFTTKNFDYSLADSLFLYSEKDDSSDSYKAATANNVLELKAFKTNKKKTLPAEKSIDLNNADISILMSLPGIGEKTAQKIIEYRQSAGGFKNIEEVQDVKGIGPAKFGKIKNYIFVEK